jgi:hypothetical protein
MVTKKGRFGTDPYSIFLNHGTSRTPSPTVDCALKIKSGMSRTLSRQIFPLPVGEGQGEGISRIFSGSASYHFFSKNWFDFAVFDNARWMFAPT